MGQIEILELTVDGCMQADLWQFYLEPSLYGQEVYTVGGSRGSGRAYYVPLLSGFQLFCNMKALKPTDEKDADDFLEVGGLIEPIPVS